MNENEIPFKVLGDYYEPFPPEWTSVASVDTSESYTVDRTEILIDEDGTALLATASGCSCWDGDWQVARYENVEDLLTSLGPMGTAEFRYQPSFEDVENLRLQVERWQAK